MLVVHEMKKVTGSMTSQANTYLTHKNISSDVTRVQESCRCVYVCCDYQVRYPRNPPCRDR